MTAMRKFFVVFLLFLGMVFIVLNAGELENTIETLRRANLWFLILALLLLVVWMTNTGLTYRSIYHLLGMEEESGRMTLAAAASIFVNIVTPTAGMGGIAVFINDARQRGHPSGKVTLAGALFILFDQAAFLVILALGLLVLIRRNHLNAGEIVASLLLFTVASIFAFLLYLGYRSADELGNMLARGAHFLNRIVRLFIRRDYFSEARAHAFAGELAEGLADLRQHPRKMIPPFLHALLNKTLLTVLLLVLFLAFDIPFSAGTIIAGFAISYLFMIVSPTPSGIGVVEGVMPLTLASLRVPWEAAVVLTLAFRAVTLWLPLGVGAMALRVLHLSNPE